LQLFMLQIRRRVTFSVSLVRTLTNRAVLLK